MILTAWWIGYIELSLVDPATHVDQWPIIIISMGKCFVQVGNSTIKTSDQVHVYSCVLN